jgi:hypothetical protein
MTDAPNLELAGRCLTHAKTDVETWLAVLEQGQLATIAPFGQMFVYQLKVQQKLDDRAFAIGELYRLYYRREDGEGTIPIPTDLLRVIV